MIKEIRKGSFLAIIMFLLMHLLVECENPIKTDQSNIQLEQKIMNNKQQAPIFGMQIEHVKKGIQYAKKSFQQIKTVEKDPKNQKKISFQSEENNKNIQNLSGETFQKFIQSFDYVVVFFFQKQCQFCTQFEQTYNHIAKIYPEQSSLNISKIRFAKIELNDKCQMIFKQFNVQAVPQIKFFHKGELQNHQFNFINYGNESMLRTIEWIKRITRVSIFQRNIELSRQKGHFSIFKNSVPLYVSQLQNMEILPLKLLAQIKQILIFNCSYLQKANENKQLAQFLKNSYLKHLNHEFYCTRNSNILEPINLKKNPTKQIIIQAYQLKNSKIDFVNTIFLDNKLGYQSGILNPAFIYQQNFNKYLNSEVKQWNKESIIQVFIDHNPCFVLILNNETRSKTVLQHYKKIKQQFNKNNQIPSVKFFMSDLSLTPQQTTIIKKQIIGIQMTKYNNYVYPILAYLTYKEDYMSKYVYPIREIITEQSAMEWMMDVIETVELNKGVQKQISNKDQSISQSLQDKTHEAIEVTDDSSQTIHNSNQLQESVTQSQVQVKQFFRHASQGLFPRGYLDQFQQIYQNKQISQKQKEQKLLIPQGLLQPCFQIRSITFYDFKVLLSTLYNQELFVFINWKHQLKVYELFADLTRWWEGQDEQLSYQQESQQEKQKQTQKQLKDNQKQQKSRENQNIQIVHPKTNQTPKVNSNQKQNINNNANQKQVQQQGKQYKQQLIQQDQAQQGNKDQRNLQENIQNYPLVSMQSQEQKNSKQNTQKQNLNQNIQNQKLKQNKQNNQPINLKSKGKQKQEVESIQQKYNKLPSLVNVYFLNFHFNDYPPSYSDSQGKVHKLKIQYIPSFLYFSKDKKQMSMIEGVGKLHEIQQFMLQKMIRQKQINTISKKQTHENPSLIHNHQQQSIENAKIKDNSNILFNKQNIRFLDNEIGQNISPKKEIEQKHNQVGQNEKMNDNSLDRDLQGLPQKEVETDLNKQSLQKQLLVKAQALIKLE